METDRVPELKPPEVRLPNRNFDAVLLHVYWPSREKHPQVTDSEGNLVREELPDSFRGGLRNRLAVRATALLYWNSPVKPKIVLTGGKLKGPSYPSFSGISKKELIDKYGVPEDSIIVLEEAHNTDEEVRALARLSQEFGWRNVGDIAWKTHEKSIKPLFAQNMPSNVHSTFNTVEAIIDLYDYPKVKALIGRMKRKNFYRFHIKLPTVYEVGFKTYEEGKALAREIPFINKRMLEARETRQKTRDDNQWIELTMHAIDKFKS